MSAQSPERRAHLEWIGFVQPVGVVVSLPALEKAQCFVQKNVVPAQEALRGAAAYGDVERGLVPDLALITREVLEWNDADLSPATEAHAVALPEYQDNLAADFVVGDVAAPTALAMVLDPSQSFDEALTSTGWQASPQARLERLLRDRGVPIGLLFNQLALRLVYAPRGESSGHVTFVIAEMLTVAGRPILAGLVALLSADRMFALGEPQRLPKILTDSRAYQADVSTRLSEQVLGALHTLVRGFQGAHDASDGKLLGEALREAPAEVYGGLLTTLLRLVFVLYAEDRGLVSKDLVYARHYSVGALFDKLREDAAQHPDTMDQRYGAWARLLTLFRLIYDGGRHGSLALPPRHGQLFDPDAYPFLEGRPRGATRQTGERLSPPRVSDGVVYAVLDALLVLDGERLSYRTLDVEQIGSVYEAMMGFQLVTVRETSIALQGKRKKGAPPSDPVVGLDTLLALKGAARLAHLDTSADVELGAKPAGDLKAATTIDGLLAALGKRISPRSPGVLTAGSMALQPTEERRRSGSHYTPRLLTEPIVDKTLEPVLAALGPSPTPEQILALKVCDPAMGSGAFLVAACRALGDVLVRAWQVHGMPAVPADEDPVLFARRTVAQRCLYGVDKNPFAVQLAKLSLWLVTLAREHPFTFLDHALRCGDSLVGLSREQIVSFHWAPDEQVHALRAVVDRDLARAESLRQRIQALSGSDDTGEKQRLLDEADAVVARVRGIGDAVIEVFFSESKPKARLAARTKREAEVLGAVGRERFVAVDAGVATFHWEVEFPEVFGRENKGFDAFVGNPPFSGKNGIGAIHENYLEWLKTLHEESHGNADLAAHFFRRTFSLVRNRGTLGLIATNTIAQGDTRSTGLRWIVAHEGAIYSATRRYKWPAGAAVIVSVVHVAKAPQAVLAARLDGRPVERITAFLFHTGPDEDPVQLAANAGMSFVGSYVLGMGFTFDDSKPEEATSIVEMKRLIAKDPRNAERIFPYLGGEELNTSPTHAHHRYVINFGQMTEEEARRWPDLIDIVEAKVKPARLAQAREVRARYWWRFGETTPALYAAIRHLPRVLVCSLVSKWLSFAWVPAGVVYSHKLCVISLRSSADFSLLQSRAHESFAMFSSSTMKDDLNYSPSDSFETFPFPNNYRHHAGLEDAGAKYDQYRAALMVKHNQGLTTTYNRFHDPDEQDAGILHLRALHAAMDRAVLDAYGWTDLSPTSAFILDRADDEDGEVTSSGSKAWRYRWPDDIRDEVLARLLALNATRAAEERRLGLEAKLQVQDATSEVAPLPFALLRQVEAPRAATTAGGPTARAKRREPVGKNAWSRPRSDERQELAIMLAAVLKALGKPTARPMVQLAVLLGLEPQLLMAQLSKGEQSEWSRAIGSDAKRPLDQPIATPTGAWLAAVNTLIGRDQLVDDAQTLGPGTNIGNVLTEGWADQRARYVVERLERLAENAKPSEVVQRFPSRVAAWLHAA